MLPFKNKILSFFGDLTSQQNLFGWSNLIGSKIHFANVFLGEKKVYLHWLYIYELATSCWVNFQEYIPCMFSPLKTSRCDSQSHDGDIPKKLTILMCKTLKNWWLDVSLKNLWIFFGCCKEPHGETHTPSLKKKRSHLHRNGSIGHGTWLRDRKMPPNNSKEMGMKIDTPLKN